MRFYDRHAAHRDKFEIVAVCMDSIGDMKTMADLDRELKSIVKHVWRGKKLPFPVMLDNTGKTLENFGLEGFAIKVLIDPQGRLVQGDEKTLAEKLKGAAQTDPKQ